MKILILSNDTNFIVNTVRRINVEHNILSMDTKINTNFIRDLKVDIIISYNYRYLLSLDVINSARLAINLHTSLLPHNRGAHPNFWSYFEGTPSGVTIHKIDSGIDTGEIIYQKEVAKHYYGTLRTTYDTLQNEMQKLFFRNIDNIINFDFDLRKQTGIGSYHNTKDIEKYKHLMVDGWDTKIMKIARGWRI